MHRFIPALAMIACAAAQAQAQTQAQGNADLMRTPECLSARKQLDQVLDQGGPRDRLDEVRQQAAQKCLGLKAAPLPESRFVPPPQSVEPISLRSETALSMQGPAAPPPPPVAIPRPPVVTICDAAGCWDAAGARYNRQGPVLVGPHGVCTQPGGLLNCP